MLYVYYEKIDAHTPNGLNQFDQSLDPQRPGVTCSTEVVGAKR